MQDNKSDTDLLRAYRVEIIRGLRVIALVAGAITLIYSFWLALSRGNPIHAIFLIILYLCTIAVFFAPGISDLGRLSSSCGIAYLLALNALINLGPLGAGRLWLVAFCAVTGAFLGFRAGLLAIGIATLTFIGYAFSVMQGWVSLPPQVTMSIGIWIDQMLDVPLFAMITTLPTVYLMNSLRRRYEKERQQRDALQAANAELKDLNDDLQAFDYSVSNALQAPLRRLSGYLELVRHEVPADRTGKPGEYLDRVDRMAGEMSELLNGLMVLSRIKRKEMVRTWQDAGTLIRSVIKELREADPDRAFHVDIQEGVRVNADQYMLRHVFISLIDNAWKYTRTVRMPRLVFSVLLRNGRQALSFSDNGIGIKREDREAIFEPFHSYHTRGDFTSAGLSLPITRRIITRHGGDIHVEDNEMDGADFILTLGEDDSWIRLTPQ